MKLLTLFLFTFQVSAVTLRGEYTRDRRDAPIVKIRNGTYKGISSLENQQDYFLGIPYAQAPLGDLRFRNPKSLNSTWAGFRNSSKFSPACVGYGPSQIGYEVSEDCLYLNVIRPFGLDINRHGLLPVAVWIHGGGFVQGSGVDLRYNLSFIVQESVGHGTPMIGVTINYRLGAWGFLQGSDASESDGSNFGLRDQRLALHWIQENIAAFGGDPEKVTLWGQSAGAASVGLHITAYGGRNDGLFRSAIMQSGAPIFLGDQNRTTYYQAAFRNLTSGTSCATSSAPLSCLRNLPFADLNAILNTTAFRGIWTPQIDGDIIERQSSAQLADGSFVQVPIIIGANSDEGTSFSPMGVNSTALFEKAIITSTPRMNASFAQEILKEYPDDPSQQVLANLGPTFRPGIPEGYQYRRAATYYGDSTMIANRRLTCQVWASFNLTAYCYRFNAIPAWADQLDGATHFVEVAFSMLTLSGVGYPPVRVNPFEGKPKTYVDLARLMSSDWISFIANGNVKWKRRVKFGVPEWPNYSIDGPMEFVYDANVTSFIAADTYREGGIELINAAALPVYGR
ncbi:Alpha/Beta hydrolase protein [Pyrenochaeta sp. MPI-SDFR-AT-0127]|nr:Alpha/Beta hydrolase protein [Pyrenochaeta sp. MPI-SDFR-AT-0127]